MANRGRNNGNSERLYFLRLQNHCRWWLQPWEEKMLLERKAMTNLANRSLYSQSSGFSSSHMQMWELDHKESWAPKNLCFQTVVLDKTLTSPLDRKEIKQVNSKGNQPWIFTGRTDAETKAPILCQPDVKSWLTGKDPDAGKNWGQEEKETTEDEMAGWHQWLNGHKLEQAPGDGEGQGSLACCSAWGPKELDVTKRLNNKYRIYFLIIPNKIQIT